MTTSECASCADGRAEGAVFCEVCGNRLNQPPCPNCGAPGGVGADGYCEQCGMLAGRPRDHIENDMAVAAAVTDRGLRHHRNEDAMWLAVRGTDVDAVVCDGVSSSFDPDVASETGANAAGNALTITPFRDETDNLIAALIAAGEAVAGLVGNGDPRRAVSNPACTIVAATVRGPDVTVAWVGDSRAYWVSADNTPAEQLTEDDSWATHAIAMGADPIAAMRDPKAHAITAWLGADAGTIHPRTGAFTVREAGHLVLCSDGLWNYLPDPLAFGNRVRQALRTPGLLGAARDLVDFARVSGGADNITVVIIPVVPAAPETEAAASPHDATAAGRTGSGFPGPDLSGPDFTGPDFTGPDLVGLGATGSGSAVSAVDTATANGFPAPVASADMHAALGGSAAGLAAAVADSPVPSPASVTASNSPADSSDKE